MSDGPHHLSGPFLSKESMIFWCFKHCPALDDLPEKVLSFAAASYHWDHSLLRLLRNISVACPCFCIARSSDRQTPSSSAPGPTDSKPERSLHFLSAYDSVLYHWRWVLFAQLEGEQRRPQPLQSLSVNWPFQGGLSAWWQATEESSPSVNFGLILMDLGFLAEKKTGSWCVQESALETSGLMTDMLVSWDKAVQLRKVARASDLCRSSGPYKKAIASGKRLDY